MFERYTDRARRVVVLAQEEARNLGHTYVGTEHILLGLIHEGDGIAAQSLTALGVSLDETRARVEAIIGRGELPRAQDGPIHFTPRTKKVLDLAAREALQLDHDYIGTEHLLLGLMREGDGVGAQVLGHAGLEFSAVRHQIRELLRGRQESNELPGERPATRPRPSRIWAADQRRAERGFDVSGRGAGDVSLGAAGGVSLRAAGDVSLRAAGGVLLRGVGDIGSRLAAIDARLAVIEQRLNERT